MRKSKTLLVQVEGALGPAVTAKDLALHVMAALGAGGGTGHVIEYRGTTIDRLSMEARMTLCNMAIEAGARAGLIAVDATTLSYLKGRERSPQGTDWAQASDAWKAYRSDEGAQFDRQVYLDARPLQPMVTWGTSPEMVVPVSGRVPDPADEPNQVRRQAMIKAQAYMDLTPGQAIASIALNKVFIGSCTNARIEDLRQAAEIVRGKAVHPRILQALVVPGSGQVKQQAEREGLDRVFVDAGFEWRAPGCSMCLGMNADHLLPGERCASTSNRNFEGRQGAGGRSHLVSPAMAAAAAINGCFTDISTVHA
jgi:3-isopropylmalate/(R)-2-methylmalate dehydratase large subunit